MENHSFDWLANYATKEVFTVFGTLLIAWLGWKASAKTIGLVGSIAKKASFTGLATAFLVTCGLGAAGYGVGELKTQASDQNDHRFTNEQLLKLSERGAEIGQILEYSQSQNTSNKKPESLETVASPSDRRFVSLDPKKAEILNKGTLENESGYVVVLNEKQKEGVLMTRPFASATAWTGFAMAFVGIAGFVCRMLGINPTDEPVKNMNPTNT